VASAILQAVMALVLLPFIRLSFPMRLWPVLLASGVLFSFGFYYSVKAYKALETSIASPLFNLGTIIVIALSMIFLHEKLTLGQLIGVTLLIAGTYILELKRGQFLSPIKAIWSSKKIHLILWSSLFYSIHAVVSKYILTYLEPATYLFIELILMSLILSAFTFIRHNGMKDIVAGFQVHRMMIFLIALFSLLAELTLFMALKNGEASLVIPVVRTWTLLVVILGGTFLKEGHLRNRVVATAIMLAGVFIIYL